MVKKKRTLKKDAQVRKASFPLSAFILKAGAWKNTFTAEQCRLIVAGALNECVRTEEMHLVGYLLTKDSVCIVLQMEQAQTDKMLMIFYEKVQDAIRKRLDIVKRTVQIHLHPFEQQPLWNEQLIRLLTGRKPDLPYYDPRLARIKKWLEQYSFCSVIDYTGAEGPVIVRLLDGDPKVTNYRGDV